MAENDSSDPRFEELQQRWRQDPSSRIFMQLAEEYRRRGQIEPALQVLEEGLKHHPGSVSAQVALGRCRLEAGLMDPALAALEAVVRKDPTQMVAYRLLVDVYLLQGDAESARERLELYSQLNAQDPEIPDLEAAIARLEEPPEAPAAAAVPEEPAAAPPPPPPASESEAPPVASAAATPSPLPPGTVFRLVAADLPPPNLGALLPPSRRPPAASPEAIELEAPTGDTATLGGLYLEQGHSRDAEQIFRRVLDRDPENPVARHGLDAAAALAEEGDAAGTSPAEGVGLSAKKAAVLRDYLATLRANAKAGDVS